MSGSRRPSLAVYGAGSCGGCEVAVLNIGERVLMVDKVFEVVFFPFLEDFKKDAVERLQDGSIDVCLFNGCMRTTHDVEMAELLRSKAKLLVAFGSCAQEGCVPGLANLHSRSEILSATHLENPSTQNSDRIVPKSQSETAEGEVCLPQLLESVATLEDVVEVDYTVPGCPPEPDRVWQVLQEFISACSGGARLPEAGAVLGAESFGVCEECSLERRDQQIQCFVRAHQTRPEEGHCLLEQGIICLGVATRAGCGALCPSVGMGCRGCYGTLPGGQDQGCRVVAALSSAVGVGSVEDDEGSIERAVEEAMATLADPVGTLYRFSLPTSLLKRARTCGETRTDT